MWPNPHETADLVTLLKKSLMENSIFCVVYAWIQCFFKTSSLKYLEKNICLNETFLILDLVSSDCLMGLLRDWKICRTQLILWGAIKIVLCLITEKKWFYLDGTTFNFNLSPCDYFKLYSFCKCLKLFICWTYLIDF